MSTVRYFADLWNRLDFALVVSAVIGIVAEKILTSGAFPINPQVFRVLRVFHITRALKAVRMAGRIKNIARLVDTLFQSIPAMTNIASLAFLIMFIFTVMALDFFGYDEINWVLHFLLFFRSFSITCLFSHSSFPVFSKLRRTTYMAATTMSMPTSVGLAKESLPFSARSRGSHGTESWSTCRTPNVIQRL